MKRFIEGTPAQTSIYDRHPGLKEAVQRGYPDTVLLIPDGNGRWARNNNVSIPQGHESGAQVLIQFMPAFVELPSKTFIPWAFSYDNWDRPDDERDGIMQTVEEGLIATVDFLQDHQIRFIRLGRENRIRENYPSLWKTIRTVEELTKDCDEKLVALPLDFNGTDQIVRILERFNALKDTGEIPQDFRITPEFAERLRDGRGLVKPADAIIRTSGEQRTSDLGWLNTNSEFFVIPKFLPDCKETDFVKPYIEYPDRQRRFGQRPAIQV